MGQSSTNTRADGQLSALAGEFFVAAELLKRGLQTSITFGNAKSIDLLAHNPDIDHTFPVQVKVLRKTNYFLISRDRVKAGHIYVFVLLNKPGEAVQYFIVPGSVLINEPNRFGKGFSGLQTSWNSSQASAGIRRGVASLRDCSLAWTCTVVEYRNITIHSLVAHGERCFQQRDSVCYHSLSRD